VSRAARKDRGELHVLIISDMSYVDTLGREKTRAERSCRMDTGDADAVIYAHVGRQRERKGKKSTICGVCQAASTHAYAYARTSLLTNHPDDPF
jgi:hypothetical protein